MERPDFIKEILFDERNMRMYIDLAALYLEEFYLRNDLQQEKEIIILRILEGAKYFSNALLSSRYLDAYNNFGIRDVKVNSYNNKLSKGKTKIDFSTTGDIKNKIVIVIDDIYDTGNTLFRIDNQLKEMNVREINNIVMIKRTGHHDYDIPLLTYGVEVKIKDYLVGCGLDYNGGYRNLPFVATVKK